MSWKSTGVRLLGAQRRDLALVEHAQQARLQLERHVGDLVEEQRAAVGLQDLAAPAGALRAGEGAGAVAEQLGLDQRLGQAGAVDGDEGAAGVRAGVVHRAREHLLAGAGLAAQQHRRLARDDAARGLEVRDQARILEGRARRRPARAGGDRRSVRGAASASCASARDADARPAPARWRRTPAGAPRRRSAAPRWRGRSPPDGTTTTGCAAACPRARSGTGLRCGASGSRPSTAGRAGTARCGWPPGCGRRRRPPACPRAACRRTRAGCGSAAGARCGSAGRSGGSRSCAPSCPAAPAGAAASGWSGW